MAFQTEIGSARAESWRCDRTYEVAESSSREVHCGLGDVDSTSNSCDTKTPNSATNRIRQVNFLQWTRRRETGEEFSTVPPIVGDTSLGGRVGVSIAYTTVTRTKRKGDAPCTYRCCQEHELRDSDVYYLPRVANPLQTLWAKFLGTE